MFGFKLGRNKDAAETPSTAKPAAPSLFARLKQGLSRTGSALTRGLVDLVGSRAIDEDLLEEVETRLLSADVGVQSTARIIKALRDAVSRAEARDADGLFARLEQEMIQILEPCEHALAVDASRKPYVILVAGVNGAGKTTTIGKLALRLREQGLSVMLAAGDTFRAAAVEQLQVWGERNGVPVISQGQGADSASVVFDALSAAKARGVDVLIADTAGRLHTQDRLMDELKKVKRVLGKQDPTAPHETLLVLDASAGQNALNQAVQFSESIGIDGVVLTKLDGTAKGGIAFAIAARLGLPFRFIGIGEGIEDLREFKAEDFVRALLDRQPPG